MIRYSDGDSSDCPLPREVGSVDIEGGRKMYHYGEAFLVRCVTPIWWVPLLPMYINGFGQTWVGIGKTEEATAVFGCGLGSGPAVAGATDGVQAAVIEGVSQTEDIVVAAVAESGISCCGRLCQSGFWLEADVQDLDTELAKGSSITARDGRGFTPLHYSASLADFAVVEALLSRGAEVGVTVIDL